MYSSRGLIIHSPEDTADNNIRYYTIKVSIKNIYLY